MIYRQDGKPYCVTGSIQQFDDGLPERDLFNQWDQDAIKQGGTPVFYYELFIDTNNTDPIYLESRVKNFSPNPVQLYGIYEPVPSQNLQTAFGIDSPDEMIIEFNYKSVLNILGHPPKIGSRLFTPFLKENWVIIERKTGEFKMYGVLRLQCICQRFQEDDISGTSINNNKDVDYKII
jgi:hypothetical protein